MCIPRHGANNKKERHTLLPQTATAAAWCPAALHAALAAAIPSAACPASPVPYLHSSVFLA